MYLLIIVGLATVAAFDYRTMPGFNESAWWGPHDLEEDTRIIPMKIKWLEDDIQDMINRVKNRRPFTPPLKGANYNYGTNTDTINYWLDYLVNEYNFTERLEYMNQVPHYKTMIQGLYIHFIRIVPEVPECKYSIPVLLMHGWPGSVREFYEVFEDLTKVEEERPFVLELIVPSIPGFGYSDSTNKQGMGAAEIAVIFKLLMNRLGHQKFMVQGGDWGALIGSIMATLFPDDIIGYHSNMGVAFTDEAFALISTASIYPEAIVPTELVSRLYPLKTSLQYFMQEFGYLHIQATKSDTIGICVGESPTSLIAWFLTFFSLGVGIDKRDEPLGGVDIFTREQFLDNIMNYWFTQTVTTSFRIYAETFNLRNYDMGFIKVPTSVPTVIVQAAHEISYMPPAALNTKFTNLVAVDVLSKYGHFLALEAPKEFPGLVLRGIWRIIEYRESNNM